MDYCKIENAAIERLIETTIMFKIIHDIKRIINNEKNQYAYNIQHVDPLGDPVVYQIELTNHCPMTCVMCVRTTKMKRELGYMEESLFEKIIQEASEFSSRIFIHHFGDSLLHPNLGKFINYANKNNIKTFLSTNPVLLTERRSKELVDNGLFELVLSLDGVSRNTNAKIRGKAAENVELAEKNILFITEYKSKVNAKYPSLIMQIVRQKQNLHEIVPWIKKWQKVRGIDRVKIKSYITWDGQDEVINSLKPDESNYAKIQKITCDKPWTSVTILWDGRVVPCCFDYDGIYELGDLKKQSLKEIWGGNVLKNFRKCHSEGRKKDIKLCEKCTDMEGYIVRKWYYPLNRIFTSRNRLGAEWSI